MSVKKSVTDLHVKSVKHANGKARLVSKESRTMEITQTWKRYDASVHPKGETLSDSVRVFRVKVVTTFLQVGVPLSKVYCFRDLLEERGFSQSDRSNLSQLIPFIHQEEVSRVKQEISGKKVSPVYDGTTHVAEALVIMLRFFY